MYRVQLQPIDLLDDSIYSSSMLSPSITAGQPITPHSMNNSNSRKVQFEFPAELLGPPSRPPSSYSGGVMKTRNDSNLQQRKSASILVTNPVEKENCIHTTAPFSSSTPTTRSSTFSFSGSCRSGSSSFTRTEDVNPKQALYKQRRKRNTMAGTVAGVAVGGITLGPVGAALGACVGSVATNKICKLKERKKQRKYEQENFQKAASRSAVARQEQGAFC